MSDFAAASSFSGPSEARLGFLRRVGVFTFVGLTLAAIIGAVSMFTIAPAVYSMGRWGGLIVVLGTWALAHFVCRSMVYGSAKLPGFFLAAAAEGVALGFLLLSTVALSGADVGMGLIAQALGLTAMTAFGMLVYVWFNKSSFSLVKAGLSMAFFPMLALMALQLFFPMGGVFGLIISVAFVLFSAAALLYRLNLVVHELNTDQHLEGAYEITMGILVLFWNLLNLLNRRN
jgi:FtsH-binding integral membrane protein